MIQAPGIYAHSPHLPCPAPIGPLTPLAPDCMHVQAFRKDVRDVEYATQVMIVTGVISLIIVSVCTCVAEAACV